MTSTTGWAAAVDPCFTDLLADPRNALRPPSPQTPLAKYRKVLNAAMVAIEGPPVYAVEAVTTDHPETPVSLRLYRPNDAPGLPVIVFYHGGGFVIGSFETHDGMCRELALRSAAVVIAVDYRLAPEVPFPGPLEDCHAALVWLVSNAGRLGLDASRVALCGDSAGGQLAIAAALLYRGRSPALRHVGLIYPLIDPLCASESARSLAEGYILTRGCLQWFWTCYLGMNGNASDPLVDVSTASLTDFPATTLLTAEFDPLRDEGEALARDLRMAGVDVTARRYVRMIHGFASMPGLTPVAVRVIADIATDFKQAFAE